MRLLHLYLFLLISLLLSSCFEYKEVEVEKVSNVSVESFSTKGITIGIDLKINNPNRYKISIVDSNLELFVDNRKIGSAKLKEKIVLQKKSNEIHHVTVETNLKQLLSSALPTLLGLITKTDIELGVKGDIKARAKSLSKKFPLDFKERVQL